MVLGAIGEAILCVVAVVFSSNFVLDNVVSMKSDVDDSKRVVVVSSLTSVPNVLAAVVVGAAVVSALAGCAVAFATSAVPELVVLAIAAGVVSDMVVATFNGCVVLTDTSAVPELVVLTAGIIGVAVVSALSGCVVKFGTSAVPELVVLGAGVDGTAVVLSLV